MTARVERTADFRRLTASTESKKDATERAVSDFTSEATELMQSLASVEALMRSAKAKYTQPSHFVRVKASKRMSEREKDAFDADIMELVKDCGAKIDALQDRTLLPHASSLRVEHEKEVVTYLLERLKAIASTSKRLQKRRSALPFTLSRRLLPEDERFALADKESELLRAVAAKQAAEEEDAVDPSSPQAEPTALQRPKPAAPRSLKPTSRPVSTPVVFASQEEDLEFTEEQDRRFRMENVMLHRHFQENLEDAQQMEAKMAEISNLMGQFADKIMQQQDEIEMIHHHATETKSNIKQSNKILEQTQNIGRGYGFMIFCFYLGFSILLHMLHYFSN
ncbi:hypothetical protein Poli38472_013803 [Pythium oligandrum]|uniref:t-SNARE coiled-coil homology domain-containing protein n=1 Tax=Pythium oligandrum TaxID=41045 RepID=A0A8K1C245_PYTOL|nr:hypothetical protein Poli38472_013803 [Pythium oligandrum]|eukprot:TMW55041.1 hypothetical protein Poli38472_013803 [Pythium oligandrum]